MMAIGLSKLLKCHFDIFVWTIAVSLLGLFSIAKKRAESRPTISNLFSIGAIRPLPTQSRTCWFADERLFERWKANLKRADYISGLEAVVATYVTLFTSWRLYFPCFLHTRNWTLNCIFFFYRRQFSGLIVFLLPSAIFTHHRWPG